MSSPLHDFLFDVDFGFGGESLFSRFEMQGGALPPPANNYFLLLDGTPFLLLDGGNLELL